MVDKTTFEEYTVKIGSGLVVFGAFKVYAMRIDDPDSTYRDTLGRIVEKPEYLCFTEAPVRQLYGDPPLFDDATTVGDSITNTTERIHELCDRPETLSAVVEQEYESAVFRDRTDITPQEVGYVGLEFLAVLALAYNLGVAYNTFKEHKSELLDRMRQ